MAEPHVRQVHGMVNRPIVPIIEGNIEGEDFVVSVDQSAGQLYVHFEGWICAYDMGDIVGEAYDGIWGTSPDFSIGDDADLDDLLGDEP